MKIITAAVLTVLTSQLMAASTFSIYGKDDRRDVIEETDAKLLNLSRSVVALIPQEYVRTMFPKKPDLLKNYSQAKVMCNKERFYTQPLYAICSGVLIAPNKILTANHCARNVDECKMNKFVFDYKVDSAGKTSIKSENIYSCKSIESLSKLNTYDYTIIVLDREVKDRTPVKIADNGFVHSYYSNGYFTNLDTFSGNSGSPVFKKSTGEMVGHISAGKTDLLVDRYNNCLKSNKCDEDGLNCSIEEKNMEYVIEAQHLPEFTDLNK